MVALTLTSAIVYLALALGLRRYAHARFRTGLEAKSSSAFVRLGLVDLATHLAAIATVSGVLALGVFELASWHGGTAADLQRAVERVRGLRKLFSELGSTWSLGGLAVLAVGLAIVTVRRWRTRWREVHARLPDTHPDKFQPPPARTLRQKLARVFVSRGTFAMIRGPRRWLFATALALMLPSLMYVAGQAGIPRFMERELELEDLRVGARESEALARLRAFPIETKESWTDKDEAALRRLADLYERATLDHIASTDDRNDHAPPVHVRAPTLALLAVRESILRELGRDRAMDVHGMPRDEGPEPPHDATDTSGPGPGPAPKPAPAGKQPPGGEDPATGTSKPSATDTSKPSATDTSKPSATDTSKPSVTERAKPPMTGTDPAPPGKRTVREQFMEDTRKLARERPKLWEKLLAGIEAIGDDFQREVSPVAIRRAAFSHLIGALFAEVGGTAADRLLVIDRLADRVVADGSVQRRYRAQAAVFLDSIVAGNDAVGAQGAVADLQWETSHLNPPDAVKDMPSIGSLEQRALDGDFKVWAETRRPAPSKEFKATLERFHTWREQLKFEPQSLASAVTEFEDHFAVDPARTSVADRLRKAWGGTLDEHALAIRRGRDFERSGAHGFTGGVVFGRTDFKLAGPIDFIDLTWQTQGDHVSLTLVPATGSPIAIDGLSRDVVRSALGFAADGRKTVVTIVNTAMGLQKVLLHPLLVDTAVGCAMTSLDQVVFEVLPTQGDNELSFASASYRAALELYQQAYQENIAQRLEAVEGRLKPPGQKRLDELRAGRAARHAAIEFQAMLSASPRAVFQDRSEFSPVIVNAIARCVSRSEVASCIEAELRENARARSASGLKDLSAGRVETHLVSGVRELPYQIAPTLDFARPTSSELPFSFLAQYTVTTADGNEGKPIVLETAQPAIDREVGRWIAAHPAPRDMTIAISASFARLQRLFQVALAGNLGPRFPVDRLVALARAMRSDGRVRRTAEWLRSEVDVGTFGAALALAAGELEDMDRGVANGLEECAELLMSLGRTADLWASAPADRWDAACSQQLVKQTIGLAEQHPEARAAARDLVTLHEARELHRTLQSVADRVVRRGDHNSCAR